LGDAISLPLIRRVLAINGDQAAVVTRTGAVAGTAASVVEGIDLAPLLAGQQISGSAQTGSGNVVYVGVPISLVRRPAVVGVVLTRPVAVARGLLGPLFFRIALSALIALVVAIIVAAVLAKRLTRPLHDVAQAAAHVSRGDLSQRVPVADDAELASVGVAFNEMAGALAESQRREREFLASVSHELRTPITAIRGYAEAIEDGAVKDAAGRAEAVGVIRSEADRLEHMVQDVMDLARVGSAEFHLDIARVDLAETVRDAVAAHQKEAAEGSVSLVAESQGTPAIESDRHRIRQVISNLVQNALRVTPGGGTITVRARSEGTASVLEVSDTGPGIDRDDLPHVFERSYLWRASKGTRRVGTGLGLAIVRELVSALGGRVTVESEIGRGTTFRIVLPAQAPHA
jgi:two-component system sensor histidine kinase BaeS